MEDKSTYADFVNKMLDEIELLGAPSSREYLQSLLVESGLTDQSVEEIRKHISSAISKYERMIAKEFHKPGGSKLTWNDATQRVDQTRRGQLAREVVTRCLKIRKLLREGVEP